MLKGQLFQTINQYLEQLKLAVLNGNVKLKNLTFKPDKVNEHLLMMRSPVVLKAGIIGNITIDVNFIDWKKHEVVLEDLLLIIGPNFSELKQRKDYVSNEQQFVNLANKLDEFLRKDAGERYDDPYRRGMDTNNVMSHENELNKIYKQASIDPKKAGGAAAAADPDNKQKRGSLKENYEKVKSNLPPEKQDIFSQILGLDFLTNLRFVARNIHIRYEDDQLVPRHPISFGFLIESILLHPNPNMDIFIPSSKDSQALGYYNTEKKVLDDFWKGSKDRRNLIQQLLINNVEVYLNSSSEMYIPYSLYEQTLYSPQGIFEAIPPLDLKALMKQYFERDDSYKFTLFKIERIEVHYMISSNLKPAPNRQNFVLLNNTLYNVFFNIKPETIEDLMDIMSYFKHFSMWKYFDEFKPTIRPILNSKLTNSKPAALKMRRIILKEWWRSLIWYLRVKRLIEEGREEIIPELYVEYCKLSWIKTLESFRPQSRASSARNYEYSNISQPVEINKPLWDQQQQPQGKKIFNEDEIKDKEASRISNKSAENPESEGILNKMKDTLIMVFCNVYNINVALKKNTGKTFLLLRIDQSHISGMKNYDFKDSNVATFQISNIRVFLSQNEKQKKIFGTSKDVQESNNLFQTPNVQNTKPTMLIQQELMGIQRVMEGTSITKQTATKTPFIERPKKSNLFDNTNNFGSLPPPVHHGGIFDNNTNNLLGAQNQHHSRSNILTPGERILTESAQGVFGNPMWPNDQSIQNFPKVLENELNKAFVKPSTDLMLLELKNDIILKLETRPSAGKGIQFQSKVEINDININIDSEVLINIFEYYSEIQKIYYMRVVRFSKYLKEGVETLKYQAEKKVIVFERPERPGDSFSQSQQRNNILVKDPDRSHISNHSRSQNSFDARQQGDIRRDASRNQVYGAMSEQNFMQGSKDEPQNQTEVFLAKLNDFLECNEFLVSIAFDGLNLTLTENSHSLENRADLLNIQLPKGKINVSFNFNKKNAYIVDVYGFRIETSSKFKALYFLFKKIKNLVESGMNDEVEKTMFFYDFLQRKGVLKNNSGQDFLKSHYAQPENTRPTNPYGLNSHSTNTYPVETSPTNTYPINSPPKNTYVRNSPPANPYALDNYSSDTYPVDDYSSKGYPSNAYPSNAYPSNAYPSNTYATKTYPANTYPANQSQNYHQQYM